jgi:hypothetical protein
MLAMQEQSPASCVSSVHAIHGDKKNADTDNRIGVLFTQV